MSVAAEPRGRFLTGSTMGHVVRMTMTGAAGITFVFVVDAANLFWIAQWGDPSMVAAIGFAFAIQFLSVSSGVGLMIASTALISRSIGAGERALARRQATGAAMIALAVQSALALFIVLFRHEIVALAGASGETAAMAARYLLFTVPSLSIVAVSLVANGALRAVGDGRRSMYVTLGSGLMAMVIDPPLILWLGLDGAAAGLVAFRLLMLALALRYAVGLHDLMAAPRLAHLAEVWRPFLVIALPAILTQLATPVGNLLMTMLIAPYGDAAMAGWAVVGRMTVVAFGGIFSLAGAIGGIFGQNFGAREYERLRSTYRDAVIFGLGYSLVIWAVLVAVSDPVTRAMKLTPQAAEVVHAFTHVGAGAFLFASALFVANAAFNALGKPMRATGMTWLRDGVLVLPLAWWLTDPFEAPGVVYAQAAAGALAGLLAAVWGWQFVRALARVTLPPLDLTPPRPYAHADRYRRR